MQIKHRFFNYLLREEEKKKKVFSYSIDSLRFDRICPLDDKMRKILLSSGQLD
jgi:hypothetical protein